MMSTPDPLSLLPLARDMTAALSGADRSRRLVEAVHRALPADAVALLRLEGQELVPVAARGLADEVLGRRFARGEHPRLDRLCAAPGPHVFPPNCDLPDPYDGWIAGGEALDGRVHSCLGCPLRVEGELVGLLTADALAPGAFDRVPAAFLEHLAALAAAALRTGALLEALEQRAERDGRLARELVREALLGRGDLLIGNSARMRRLREEIDLVAASDYPVLVTGETGVGKELVARSLHARSPRADQGLVYVNCAALPESIAESELFGHRRGAFTGADRPRAGKLRVADGGTLFLDEIGELPAHVQPKLLRALQSGEIQPVGADRTERVNVRVLAATNRDLEGEVRAGRFRADLLHRLDVGRIHVPALRERPEDVPALAAFFADRARQRLGTGPIRFEPAALDALERAPWPGNVRELENAISRAILRAWARAAPQGTVTVESGDLDRDLVEREQRTDGAGTRAQGGEPAADAVGERLADAARAALDAGQKLGPSLDQWQRALLTLALERSAGNRAAAARLLGLDRSNLHRRLARLDLAPPGRG